MRRAAICVWAAVLGMCVSASAAVAAAPRARAGHRAADRGNVHRHHHHRHHGRHHRRRAHGLFNSSSAPAGAYLGGERDVQPEPDRNAAGSAEAFRFTAAATGSARTVNLYVDARNRARTLVVGLYASDGAHPGRLLVSGSLSSPDAGAWNAVPVAATALTSGTSYWLAVLGRGGAVAFRDSAGGSCGDKGSAQASLTALPGTWSTGQRWHSCAPSAYVTGVAAAAGSSGTAPGSTPGRATGSSGGAGRSVTPGPGTAGAPSPSSPSSGVGTGGAPGSTTPGIGSAVVGAPGPRVSCTQTLAPGADVSGAVTSAPGGSVICLAPGNWSDISIASPMDPAAAVTLAPVPGQTVTIGQFSIDAAVENLTVQGLHAQGFSVDAPSAGGITFQYDSVQDVSQGIAFELDSSAHGNTMGTISGVTMRDNQIDHVGQCLADVDNQQDTTFSDNVCGPGIGAGARISTDPGHYIETGGENDLTVDNNAFLGPACGCAATAGLHLNVMHDWGDSDNVQFDNNVMWHVDAIGQQLLFQSGHFDDVQIDNNLDIDDPSSGNTAYAFWTTDAHGLTFEHNTVAYSYWGNLLSISQTGQDYPAGTGSDYTIADNVVTNTVDGSDMDDQECASACVYDDNVTDDGSAPGIGSVLHWTPLWLSTSWTPGATWTGVPTGYYQPIGLPFAAGYQGSVGPSGS